MRGCSSGSPSKTRHKHHHVHDHRRSPMSLCIKSEPSEDNSYRKPPSWETDHRGRHSRTSRHSEYRPSRDRLREPVVIKQEETHRKRARLHSPKILAEESPEDRSAHSRRRSHLDRNANLGHSGLLDKSSAPPVQKQKANFGLSGKLTEDTNTYKGVVIKYNEPEDARKPTEKWRLYAFKGNQALSILHIHRQSGFLIGRDRKIADIPMDHPSISKQHAVLQYRFVKGMIRLYLIDLESVNGTYLNNAKIEPRRYYELIEKDVIKFGFSTREYVVMTANVNDEDEESDN
ncbi:Smad nuclear-interacting protein 1 [Fasciolopsis buskii]|uniref:Smad nuclear-interacting protein 1 n=1 Tax=Fasciolopsis buskii TaxID=27845 RepID=A0A8E0RUK5_9TREM|nr:Smad nuclear-interacting protein 1 [Fasciolopsis buski]